MTNTSSKPRKLTTLAELLALPLPSETVDLPELGVSVELHAVTGLERVRLAELSLSIGNDTSAKRLMFELDMIGSSMGVKPEEVGRLPSTVIDRLSKVALRLCGFAPEAVEEATADLKETPSDGSG